MASAFNTTPEQFAAHWTQVRELVQQEGKDPDEFGNAVVSMLSYVADDAAEAEQVARTLVAPALGRSADELLTRLVIGRPQECADKLVAYAEAGAQRIFIRPVADPPRQLRLFAEKVIPLLPA